MIQFQNQPLKKINCIFEKICLLLQTALESEVRIFLPIVRLDFSSTLKMPDQQNDLFARLSDSVKSPVSTIYIS